MCGCGRWRVPSETWRLGQRRRTFHSRIDFARFCAWLVCDRLRSAQEMCSQEEISGQKTICSRTFEWQRFISIHFYSCFQGMAKRLKNSLENLH